MKTCFVDADVVIYAVGVDHAQKRACVQVLESIGSGAVEATTSAEVVQEVLYVLTRRGGRDRARGVAIVRQVLALFPSILPVGRLEIEDACALLERHPGIHARDALHAATALRHGIRDIVSVDPDFDAIDEVRRFTPEALARRV